MSEYWLISVPAEEATVEDVWKEMETLTKKHKLSEVFKFQIPELRIGTLDSLVSMGDELGKLDSYVGNVAHHIARSMGEIVEYKDKANENLIVEEQDLPTYMANFNWDLAKYPVSQTTQNIADAIMKQADRIEAELKTKLTSYINVKSAFLNVERKQTGSLLTRNLAELVKKEHFVLGSEYLTTLLVVVPKSLFQDWKSKYETIIEMVVPKSSELIFQDNDHGLYTVTIFEKFIQEFKQAAGKQKFIVRDFCYDEDAIAKSQDELKQHRIDQQLEHGKIVRWLKVNFGECFSAWMHVKALRVFVESVLRYGLPVKFQAMIVHPQKKTSNRLRQILNDHYGHLDMSYMLHGKLNDYGVVIPELDDGKNEYYPYVDFSISIDMLEPKRF